MPQNTDQVEKNYFLIQTGKVGSIVPLLKTNSLSNSTLLHGQVRKISTVRVNKQT